MLTGKKIEECVNNNTIKIYPFNKSQLNPNSYNIRLGNRLMVYTDDVLDSKKVNQTRNIIIPEEGYVLQPGELYLGETVESAGSTEYVSAIDGRSSTGRLGIAIHLTAGFGDIGFLGKWTLEIFVLKPVRVYPNQEIGQIYFMEPHGDNSIKYKGKYQGASGVQASKSYLDIEKGK